MNKVKLACDLQSLSRNVIMLVTAAVIVLVPFLVPIVNDSWRANHTYRLKAKTN